MKNININLYNKIFKYVENYLGRLRSGYIYSREMWNFFSKEFTKTFVLFLSTLIIEILTSKRIHKNKDGLVRPRFGMLSTV